MKLREPATFWTDCALAAWSAWLAGALWQRAPAPLAPVVGWWIAAFATCAVAATAGAVHHGLGHELSPATNRASWRLALLALVGTGLCLAQVAALTALASFVLGAAQLSAWLAAACFGAAALRRETFSVAITAYGLGQLLVLAAALAAHANLPAGYLAWLATAVATSAVAAAIQHFRVSPHPRFNHNDLYHVVQAAAQGCFYLGAASLL